MSVETREMKEIEAAVEGILFASGEPVHIDRICLAAELDRLTAELVLQKLMDYYSFERRGMRLLRLEDSWQLCSAPEYADVIRRAFDEIVKREPYPVERKAKELVERLKRSGITRFLLLFRGSRSRSELVATFMAVLELCRNNLIKLAGPAGDCTVACGDEGAEELM